MRKYPLARAALLAGGLVVTAIGCGKAEARMCQQSGEAEFCLVEDGPSYEIAGHGFRSGSTVRISVDGEEQETPVRAGDDGKVPAPGGVAGILRGPDSQLVTVTGTSSSGGDLRFQFTVPPTGT